MHIYSVPTLSLCPFPFIFPPLSLSSSPLLFGNFVFHNRPECFMYIMCCMYTCACTQLYVHTCVHTELCCMMLFTFTPEGWGPCGAASAQCCVHSLHLCQTCIRQRDTHGHCAALPACSICICTNCVYNVHSGGWPCPNLTTGPPAQCHCAASCGVILRCSCSTM
jgi:hypothetical protein